MYRPFYFQNFEARLRPYGQLAAINGEDCDTENDRDFDSDIENATREHVEISKEHEKIKERYEEAKKKFQESEGKVKDATKKLKLAKKTARLKTCGYY